MKKSITFERNMLYEVTFPMSLPITVFVQERVVIKRSIFGGSFKAYERPTTDTIVSSLNEKVY